MTGANRRGLALFISERKWTRAKR